jgi:hypothetical protein
MNAKSLLLATLLVAVTLAALAWLFQSPPVERAQVTDPGAQALYSEAYALRALLTHYRSHGDNHDK